MFDLVPFSPPGSPCSANLDNNDIAALGSVRSPSLGIPPANPASAAPSPQAGQGPNAASLQHFFSSYSTLCDWAGGGVTTHTGAAGPGGLPHGAHANTKVVLPPLSLPYGSFGGEMDNHPFSFLHPPAVAVNPWHDEPDLVDRPLFGGLDDAWRAVATGTGPYTC